MRAFWWALPLLGLLTCSAALAAESVHLVGRATGISQYPEANTVCLRFATKEGQPFLICDDVTARDVIEQLFALGKKDVPCRIEGTVAKKSGGQTFLRVTRVSQETK